MMFDTSLHVDLRRPYPVNSTVVEETQRLPNYTNYDRSPLCFIFRAGPKADCGVLVRQCYDWEDIPEPYRTKCFMLRAAADENNVARVPGAGELWNYIPDRPDPMDSYHPWPGGPGRLFVLED